MLASTVLWGDLRVSSHAGTAAALSSWLARRRAGLRLLTFKRSTAGRIMAAVPASSLAAMLASLAGSQVVGLHLRELNLGEGCEAALQPLAQLSNLASLKLYFCNLGALPASLSALQALQKLSLHWNPLLGSSPSGERSFAVLARLTSLVSLDLSSIDLARCPSHLSALGRLQQLNIAGNRNAGMGRGGSRDYEPLSHLTALTQLKMGVSGINCVPNALAALTAVKELNLEHCNNVGSSGEAGCEPLRHCTALTLLNMNSCGLEGIPPQLLAMPGLRDLELSCNPLQHGWDTLCGLSALTRLGLAACGLHSLPLQLPCLRSLVVLRVSGNPLGLAEAAVRQQLSALTSLTRLDATGCNWEAHD